MGRSRGGLDERALGAFECGLTGLSGDCVGTVVVLAVLVVRQQHNQATDHGQASLEAAAEVGAPSRANTPDQANVLIRPDAPSHAVTDHPAPVGEAPERAKAPESGDRPAKPDRSTNSNRPPNPDAQETALTPGEHEQIRVAGVPTDDH